VPKVIWPRILGARTLLIMGQNCSPATSPVLQIEDYDDFKQWQQRRHGIGLRVRTLIVLVLSAWMSYVQYSAMKTRSDRVLAQYSALKAQYDRIEAKKNETLARYSALKAQYDQIEAKKCETLAQYAALKAQYDQIEAKKDALKAQYDRIEAMRNESLAQSCAWKAQHTGMNSKKSDNIPNSLKTAQ
jgi:cell division protein FtsB